VKIASGNFADSGNLPEVCDHTPSRAQIIFPSRADQITAHYTLDRKHFGTTHLHRSSLESFSMTLDRGRHRVDIALDQVISDHIFQPLKPEFGESCEHFAFTFDRRRQYAVEGGDAICDDNEQAIIVDFVNVTHFTAPV
jgi:hypothetical protein